MRKSAAVCLSVTMSTRRTTFSCVNSRRIFISLIAVIGNPSFSFSSRTFFSATKSPADIMITVIRLANHQSVCRAPCRPVRRCLRLSATLFRICPRSCCPNRRRPSSPSCSVFYNLFIPSVGIRIYFGFGNCLAGVPTVGIGRSINRFPLPEVGLDVDAVGSECPNTASFICSKTHQS